MMPPDVESMGIPVQPPRRVDLSSNRPPPPAFVAVQAAGGGWAEGTEQLDGYDVNRCDIDAC